MKLILSPVSAIGIDSSEELRDLSLEIPDMLANFRKHLGEWKGDVEMKPRDEPWEQDSTEIVFLGTGAAIPSKYRNGRRKKY